MAYGLSNGHMTDDVTGPREVKFVTPIRLERDISKTAGETHDSVTPFQRTTNSDIWGIKWSRDRWRHVCPKVLEGLQHLWGPRDVSGGSTVGYPSDSLASCYKLVLRWFLDFWTIDFRDILYLYFSLHSAYCILFNPAFGYWLKY